MRFSPALAQILMRAEIEQRRDRGNGRSARRRLRRFRRLGR
jgi:hypothetical protein